MGALYGYSIDQIALAAATAKTVVEIGTAANDRALIKEWWIDFDGVTSSAVPVKVEVGRFSAGVTTATAVTPFKMDPGDGASSVTFKHSASSEGAGTAVDTILRRISPTSGFHYVAPLGQEFKVGASSFWRIRLTAAAVVNATVGVLWDD